MPKILEMPLQFHGTVENLVSNIDHYLNFNASFVSWKSTLETLSKIQIFLMRYRYKFPVEWLYVEQLENNISMVQTLLDKKKLLIEENLEVLASKIKSEAAKANDSVNSLGKEWQVKKPIGGSLNPGIAMVDLGNFEKDLANYMGISSPLEIFPNISTYLFLRLKIHWYH